VTVKELTYVVLKVLGLLFLLQVINLIPLLVQVMASIGENDQLQLLQIASTIISVSLIALLGIILLRRTDWVVRKMGVGEFSDLQGSIQIEEFQTIAFSVIGVVLIGSALPDLARVTAGPLIHALIEKALQGKGIPYGGVQWPPYNTEMLFKSFVQLAVGLYLFFKAAGIASLWQQLQERKKQID
jgi:hypothetical protein